MNKLSMQAVDFNNKVINNYGAERFEVIHSGGLVSFWSAMNRKHLDLLLQIEKNSGYILSIDSIKPVEHTQKTLAKPSTIE